MKTCVRLTLVLVMVLPAMIFSVSCSKNAVQSDPVQMPRSELSEPDDTHDGNDMSQAEATALEASGVDFVNRNIYFEFDSAALSSNAQRVLTDKADYLRTNPDLMITIEGHCDERGTEEYNMALGDLRAKSAKQYLLDMGIPADRLNTITYGEERPMAHSRDEASWAKNRRAQFVIK